VNQNREYPSIEIDWQPALDNNGNAINAKDGTPIVISEPMKLTPKIQGQFGGWAFEDVKGFWSLPPSAPSTAITVGVPAMVTLSLGGHKSTGGRYENIWDIAPVSASQATGEAPQAGAGTLQAEKITEFVDRDAQRNESIREQAFYNHFNVEAVDRLSEPQQDAMWVAYFNTAMKMMSPLVQKRAIAALEAATQAQADAQENGNSPMVQAAVDAGGTIIEETVEKLPWN
jgi:hypothetical protein